MQLASVFVFDCRLQTTGASTSFCPTSNPFPLGSETCSPTLFDERVIVTFKYGFRSAFHEVLRQPFLEPIHCRGLPSSQRAVIRAPWPTAHCSKAACTAFSTASRFPCFSAPSNPLRLNNSIPPSPTSTRAHMTMPRARLSRSLLTLAVLV